MVKKKTLSKTERLKKLWDTTKKTAKHVQKEARSIGEAATKVGKGLSATGDVINQSFRPTAVERKPTSNKNIPPRLLPRRTLRFGWGGY